MTLRLLPNLSRVASTLLFGATLLPADGLRAAETPDAKPPKRTEFAGEFAPSEGWVRGPEKETRREICLNGAWDFQPIYGPYEGKKTPPYGIEAKETAPEIPDPVESGWEKAPVKVPSSWSSSEEFPSYSEKWADAKMGWLRKKFTVPADWKDLRIVLRFQAVSGDCEVFLNGVRIGGSSDSAIPFSFDVTSAIRKGAENEVLVGIRDRALFNWPGAYGNIVFPPGAPSLGIWQDVYLLALPGVHVSDVFIKPAVGENRLRAEVTVRNATTTEQSVKVEADVKAWVNLAGQGMLEAPEVKWKLGEEALRLAPIEVKVPAGEERVVTLETKVDDRLKFWNFDSPNLYGMTVSLTEGDRLVDKKYERFGWREFKLRGDGLFLNGEKVQLRGDSQHLQNVTFMTRRYAWSWFKLLKDINGNAARFHAMVYPSYFHDMADEMGIAVLPESSIYASSCDLNYDSDLFWKVANHNVRGLVMAYRNHPSVFGWSVENEALPALNVKCNDPAYKKMVYDRFDKVADNCRELDPTREWISGDGSKDMDGRFPVYLEHYGSVETYLNEKASTPKPYGVGEACIAYYAKPRQSEMYVGDRAYRSYADHSDAIAIDAFELLKVQRGFSVYCSIWNAGYYGVEPLPLGQADTSRPPTKEDGVFLTAPYAEGKPGAQPERIPPYLTQYNPGYDPGLPLYQPMALYDAVKAAYQPTPAANPWDHRQTFETPAPPEINHPAPEVLFIGQDDGDLFFRLKSVGIPLVTDSASPRMIVVDCATAVIDEALAAKIKGMVEAGATAIFWGLTPGNQSRFAAALPAAFEVFDRPATSLVKNEGDNRVASIRYRDLYFTENPDAKTIMRFGLRGDFVKQGNVLLRACPVDWSQDNTRGMIRSERENPAGPCFVELKSGAGAYIVSTIDLAVVTPAHARVLSQLFTNLGVKVRAVHPERGGLLDQTSGLTRALLSEPFRADSTDAAMKTDFVGEATIKPEFQMKTAGHAWSVQETKDGGFDFAQPGSSTGREAVYLSFWIQCPQALNEILADPNVPQVGLKISAAGGIKLWLNGQEKFASSAAKTDTTLEKLPLVKGWNHFLIKVVSSADGWRFSGRLLSKNFELLAGMKSALNPFSERANFNTIEHTDPEINYEGAWGLEGDGWYQSFTPGDKARFKFYGTGVSLTGRVGPDGGKARLAIDGKVVQEIDYKQAAVNRRVPIFSKSGFRGGEHEVTLEVISGRVTLGPYDQWESY